MSAFTNGNVEIRNFVTNGINGRAAALARTHSEPPYNRSASIDDASKFLKRATDQEATVCLVAVAGPDIVEGLFARSLTDDGTSLNITELFVVPEWCRQGVARALVSDLTRAGQVQRKSGSLSIDRRLHSRCTSGLVSWTWSGSLRW